jgi:hypothetical protein
VLARSVLAKNSSAFITYCFILAFASYVLAVTIAYGSALGGFAGKLFAFKTQLHAFAIGAVADLTKLVFPSNAADAAVWACAFLHFGAFFAGDSTNANLHKH